MPRFGPLPPGDIREVLSGVGDWEALRGARLFITGGTGFFGIWLLESLLNASREFGLGLRATVLTRDPEAFLSRVPHLAGGPFDWLAGDVRRFRFPEGPFSHVIHGAVSTRASLYRDDPGGMLETITDGTRRVLEFAIKSCVGRLLFISSGAIYGPQPAGLRRLPEEYSGAPDPLDPAGLYGQGKRFAESLCALCHQEHGIEIPIARCFAFVGPHLPLDSHFAIGNFLQNAVDGNPILVRGDGTPMRSYLYASDLASWLITLLLRGRGARAYNVGSSDDLTILELAQKIARHFNLEAIVETPPRPGTAPMRYVPDTTRIQEELGLRPRVGLDEAILRSAGWASMNPGT